ncbi:hypothetical protein MNBD_GAMMA09-935 [hydrothermal vent metagenome]|uniref:Cds6 C-terminal domain-containing protein n=1 Tax=hydrothermal vent metagenome TaxID=652676 RepID=A0A3B0X8D5_9ZZZZ
MKYKRIYKSLLISLLFFLNLPAALQAQTSVDKPPSATTSMAAEKVLTGGGELNDKKLFSDALVLISQSEWVQAEMIYRDLIKRNPSWPEVKNNLAVMLLKTGRLDDARKLLESAVVSSPAYRVAHNNRTKLYDYLAMQAYNKALGAEQTAEVPELELIQKLDLVAAVTEKKPDLKIENPAFEQESRNESSVPAKKEVPASVQSVKQIRQQLLNWSKAWSAGDFDQYILHYSMQFVPSDSRKTFSQWKINRKSRLKYSKGADVEIDQLRVFPESTDEPDTEYALVEFLQYYESALYTDKVLKQMYMEKQQQGWLILSERIIKTY